MPIYEYGCDACGRTFETIVLSGSSPSQKKGPACPGCGGRKVTRRLSTFSARSSNGTPSRADDPGSGSASGGGCGRPGGCGCH
ncbi:MAG TPA: zinc ribbon domain-containing protein [Candidatus Polarisedimenticolia bacterium]|nr:zinc ribbon domain-containing protein [Candidatus Polarisedimenticolia bacterium]